MSSRARGASSHCSSEMRSLVDALQVQLEEERKRRFAVEALVRNMAATGGGQAHQAAVTEADLESRRADVAPSEFAEEQESRRSATHMIGASASVGRCSSSGGTGGGRGVATPGGSRRSDGLPSSRSLRAALLARHEQQQRVLQSQQRQQPRSVMFSSGAPDASEDAYRPAEGKSSHAAASARPPRPGMSRSTAALNAHTTYLHSDRLPQWAPLSAVVSGRDGTASSVYGEASSSRNGASICRGGAGGNASRILGGSVTGSGSLQRRVQSPPRSGHGVSSSHLSGLGAANPDAVVDWVTAVAGLERRPPLPAEARGTSGHGTLGRKRRHSVSGSGPNLPRPGPGEDPTPYLGGEYIMAPRSKATAADAYEFRRRHEVRMERIQQFAMGGGRSGGM